MKTVLRQHRIIPSLLSFCFVLIGSLVVVHAQTSGTALSGDEICGSSSSTKCTLKDLGTVFKNTFSMIIMLGLPILVVSVTYRFVMAWFAAVEGNASAYKEALKKSTNAIIGFMLIVVMAGGGMFALLKYLGVRQENGFNPLQIFDIFSNALVMHTYAATGPTYSPLPNPLVANNLYELILSVLRLIIRFFVYPALIIIWVWTGFAFVFAQGKPEALAKAKGWFVKAFITTLVIMLLQTFLIAIQGTVAKILPSQKTTQDTPVQNNQQSNTPVDNGTPDGRIAPGEGAVGSSCTRPDGSYGQVTSDGSCGAGRGESFDVACNVRNGGVCKKNGVQGTCSDYLCVLP